MDWTRSVLEFVYDTFFGCRHDRLTRPFTIQRQTYKVCLDCGSHVYYSAERMEPLHSREIRRLRKVQAGEVRILESPIGPQLVPTTDRNSGAAA